MSSRTFIHTGTKIKVWRENAKITQQELAHQLGYKHSKAGGQFISTIERGKAGIPPLKAPAVCGMLRVKPFDMVKTMMLDYRDYLQSFFPGLRIGMKVIDLNNQEAECTIPKY